MTGVQHDQTEDNEPKHDEQMATYHDYEGGIV